VKNLLIAGAVATLCSLFGTPLLMGWLRRRGIGQQIRDDGPQRHLTKAGTPTMGGMAILAAMFVGYMVEHVMGTFTVRGIATIAAIGAAGFVGFLDDWIKHTRRRSLGLNKRAKSAGQLVVAIGFAVVCAWVFKVDTRLSFTRYNSTSIQLGKIGWAILAVLIIWAATNAVNLTDGLDGLATGNSAFVFVTFTIVGFYQFKHPGLYRNPASLDEAALCAAMVGALAGFLWWNGPPAKIFMGDTGSLGIGAAMATIALLENVDLLLPIVAGLFVVETLSVIIQIISFRVWHRRVFRMAPIHHHFELLGWPETTVLIRFWIVGAAFASLALGLFYADFLNHVPGANG